MDRTSTGVAMRPFGDAVDLEVDFGQPDRPGLVTTLLAHCCEARSSAFWWSQAVSQRTAALLRLVALTEQRAELLLSARCTDAACGEPFEFELPLRALSGSAGDSSPMQVRLDAERSLTLRRPTGDDLRRWRDAQPASRAEAVRIMLDSLVLAGQAGPEDEAVLSASIQALDPLVDLAVSCQCPACDASNDVAVDLEALALARLAARQGALVQEVHRLASNYGWTESEVLAVPAARRAQYLALIEDLR